MLPPLSYLKENLRRYLVELYDQGFDTAAAVKEFESLPESYDRLIAFAETMPSLPPRGDWPYVEPVLWRDVEAEMAPDRQRVITGPGDVETCRKKAEAAFQASVLGCILGKPVEINPDLDEMRKAGEACGQWPLDDFISVEFLEALGRRHPSWPETTRGNIRWAAADDDIHYSIMGMINLEKYGLNLDMDGVRDTWLNHQCMNYVWGPERHAVAWIAVKHLFEEEEGYRGHQDNDYYLRWSGIFNPGSELCGAAIRADAYGYAFPGRPDLAARAAWTDASFTHRRTGVYSTMYLSAAMALMYHAKNKEQAVQAMEDALLFVPQKSRFHENTKLCLYFVKSSAAFDEAYRKIHERFREYDHCRVVQEIGTVINTVKFADGIWDGVCKQVSQGNDTDSFGCTAGSLLGIYYGPEALPHDKLALFNDDIHVSLASFHEHSLSALAKRMGNLPRICPH